MKMKTLIMLLFFAALGFISPCDGCAAIYQYTNKDGVICLDDDLQSIPEQYRAAVKIVSGEVVEEERRAAKQPQARSAMEADGPASFTAEGTGAFAGGLTRFFTGRHLNSLIIAGSALFVYGIIGIMDKDRKKAVKIARAAVLWGMIAYVVCAHAGGAVALYRSVSGKISAIRQASEEKGKKAAKAMKEANALIQ